MSEAERTIRDALRDLADGSLADCTEALLGTLGYRSGRTIDFPSVAVFLEDVDAKGKLAAAQLATFEQWEEMDVVFQITNDEVAGASDFSDAQSTDRFGSGQPAPRQFDRGVAKSFLFLAVDLKPGRRSRSELAASTRAVNRIFPMPTVVFFRHRDGDGAPHLTIGVVHRRVHKSDPDKDVLERVSLIKDVSLEEPHRAHLQLLSELALGHLIEQRDVSNFDQLLAAWEAVLDTGELNRRFYKELFGWFQRATRECAFPDDGVGKGNAERHVIRLITRLLFVWFLKEKRLVPDALFDEEFARSQLKHHAADATDYYRAVLQNLFFATLNTEIHRRAFSKKDQSTHRDFTRYRYRDLLRDPDGFAERLSSVPFVDGGLFDCLDDFEHVGGGGRRIDAFTDNIDLPNHGGALSVPARLFFDEHGLFPLFRRYKFTVEENTPLDEEVALDPELLGRAFENLLASYNPETRDTARKATGSYYTPRRVVEYMVDEALVAHFRAQVPPRDGDGSGAGLEARLRKLVATRSADPGSSVGHQLRDDEIKPLIDAIDSMKVLDPACGSGAFPMGILQKLVSVLAKVDPDNQRWKERQLARAQEIPDPVARRDAVAAVEKSFSPERSYGDYGRKLYLIQNVIHGVDIQPIACQIAKLRFFISLVIEQQSNDDPDDNYGIQALPNLETRFVAADALIGLNGPSQRILPNTTVKNLEEELEQVRSDWFDARTRDQKWELKKKDKRIRRQLHEALTEDEWSKEAANLIADWDPYDQNTHARWFDAEWMFGVGNGFDIVIGNPPYVQLQKQGSALARLYDSRGYRTFTRKGDVYQLFYEKGCRLLAARTGVLTYITSNSWLRAEYGKATRRLFAEDHAPLRLIELGKDVFENAIVDSSILILREGKHEDACMTVDMDRFNVGDFPPEDRHWGRFRPRNAEPWVVLSKIEQGVIEKMTAAGVPLKEWNVTMNSGIKTGYNKAFVIDGATRQQLLAEDPGSAEILKPLLQGRDIRRWHAPFRDRWLICARRGTDIKKYPGALAWLRRHKGALSRKSGANAWYELQASPSDEAHARFGREKLFWMDMTHRGRFAWSDGEMYCNDKGFVMSGESLVYLCAVLNSTLVSWLVGRIALTTGMGLPQWKKYTVETIPVPKPSRKDERSIVELARRLIDMAKGDGDVSAIGEIEERVDRLVYRLYKLTAREVAAVERRIGVDRGSPSPGRRVTSA